MVVWNTKVKIILCQGGNIHAYFQNICIEITMMVSGTKCLININSFYPNHNTRGQYQSHLQMKKVKLRAIKKLPKANTASKWKSQDSHPGNLYIQFHGPMFFFNYLNHFIDYNIPIKKGLIQKIIQKFFMQSN